MPELKIYTVKDLREWLTNNHPAEGLSERVIAPTRAWAIIHNPYVRDNDAIVAAIFEDGQLAAYTASFPDMLDGKRVWWASTLYCYPQFAGRGYGMIVVGSLMEAHEPELTFDRWGARETVEIFNHFGYNTAYTKRYHLSNKKIVTSSIKGKLAYCVQSMQKLLHPLKPSKANYTLRYTSYIDGEAYAFMREHKGNDLWLREQDMLNWIIRYPFMQGCTMLNRVVNDTHFTSYVHSYDYCVVKVYTNDRLIGVHVLRCKEDELTIVYLYYSVCNEDIVFASIFDYLCSINQESFVTENKALCEYIRLHVNFPKRQEEQVSFSVPMNYILSNQETLQLGDGDSFA